MRVLIIILGLLVTVALAGPPVLAGEDPPPDPPPSTQPADPPAGQPGEGEAGEEAGEGESGEEKAGEDASGDDTEQDVPEGVRRQRPLTIEQEREYKQRKNREDIFLNAPPPVGPVADGAEFYNPADWLTSVIHYGLGSYLIQDRSGTVLGSLTYDISPESNPVLGDFIHIRQRRDFEPQSNLDLWLYAGTLKPRQKEMRTQLGAEYILGEPGVEDDGSLQVIPLYRNSQLLEVDYLFDRATIYHEAGGIGVWRTMRQMPYSFDIDALPLLVRMLDFLDPDWPFEAAVCDPQRQRNLPLSAMQPLKVEKVLSAEPATYRCYELAISLGDTRMTYWVERLAPHRLVKYTDGEHTYTLAEYLERK